MNHCNMNFIPNYGITDELLKHLNSEELTELLNGNKLQAMIEDTLQVKEIEAEREMLIATNKSLLEFNLSKKPILIDYCQKLQQIYTLASELKNELLRKKKELEQLKTGVSGSVVLALLETATVKTDDESEAFAERFLSGDIPLALFLDEYMEKRKLYHLRNVKMERFKKLLLEHNKHDMGINVPSSKSLQAHRVPPPPPIPGSSVSHLTRRYSSSNVIISSVLMPTRQAPHPPIQDKCGHSYLEKL